MLLITNARYRSKLYHMNETCAFSGSNVVESDRHQVSKQRWPFHINGKIQEFSSKITTH